MSFPPYPAYQDSSISWIGPVPAGWSVKRLRFLSQVQTGIAKGKDVQGIETIRVPYLRVANVQDGFIDIDDVSEIEIAASDLGRYLLRPGDVLMNEGGDFDKLGRGQVWNGAIDPCIHQNHVFAVRPHGIEPEWLALVTSADCGRFFFMTRAKQSTNLASISSTNLLELPVPCPPPAERRAILRFLDRETGKIDALVAEQERLIALLKEKRQAVISQAVTKGLDASAPKKDSGVAWLGQVPAHWELRRLKHISPFVTVGIVVNPSSYLADEGYPFIYGGDIREGVIDWQNARRIDESSSEANAKTRLAAGDLLTVRVGAPGVTAVVPAECEGGNCASVMLIRKGGFSSHWLCYAMNTRTVRYQVEVVQYGAAQEQFNIAHAVDFWVPTPPRAEQDSITKFLDREIAILDTLTTEAHRAIALLKERRAALISAAVTGKIDVRGLVVDAADDHSMIGRTPANEAHPHAAP